MKPAVEDDTEDGEHLEETTTEEEDGEERRRPTTADGREGTATTITTTDISSLDARGRHYVHPLSPAIKSPLPPPGSNVGFDRPPSQQRFRRIGSEVQLRPGSISPAYEGLIAGEDFSLVADYIDAIQLLTSAVNAGGHSREDILRLSQSVMDMQHRVESEIGHREPSVRELFRTATASVMRSRRSNVSMGGSGALGSTRSGAGSRSMGTIDRSRGKSLDASHTRTKHGDDNV